jgi:hypothetical protein
MGYVNRHNVHIIKVSHPPTEAQVNCLKKNCKIHIKIDVKTAPTLFEQAQIMRFLMMVIAPKHVGDVLISILM